jgi:tetratricopeptide (TPR) repeat protein
MEESTCLILEARNALTQGKAEEALEILQKFNLEDNSEALFLKGEACYHLQKWGESMNCFRSYLSKDPGDQRAKAYVDMIQNILSFYHSDQFNP